MNNFLITGIPRSGTTLLIHLIDKYSKSIVLTEPKWIKSLRDISSDEPEFFVKLLVNKINDIRTEIQAKKAIEVLVDERNDCVPQNFFIRESNATKTTIKNIKKHVLKQFPQNYSKQDLFIKTNTYFTAILKQLVSHNSVSITAVIRNPVATLKSWRSLDIPVSRGQLKIAALFSDNVKTISQIDDLLIRQVKLLDWFYQQYHLFSQQIKIIKYEDLVEKPQQILNDITPLNKPFVETLNSMNNSPHYDHAETRLLTKALLTHGQHYATFYDLNTIDTH